MRMLSRVKRWLLPVPTDPRGRRFVAVIECILNQNARDEGAACTPAMNFRLLQLCHKHDVGVLQMPCPEIHALGFARERSPGRSIREALNDEASVKRCAALAHDVTERMAIYFKQGYELVAVLGGNPESPGCAIHEDPDSLSDRAGLFMRKLQTEFRQGGFNPRFLAIRDHDPDLHQRDLEAFERLLSTTSSALNQSEERSQ